MCKNSTNSDQLNFDSDLDLGRDVLKIEHLGVCYGHGWRRVHNIIGMTITLTISLASKWVVHTTGTSTSFSIIKKILSGPLDSAY